MQSHRPGPEGWHPEAPFHFVDGVAAAIATAKDLVIHCDRVLHPRDRVRR